MASRATANVIEGGIFDILAHAEGWYLWSWESRFSLYFESLRTSSIPSPVLRKTALT